LYLDVSPKALRRIREELRRRTRRTGLSLDAMIADLNPYIRGARHYFRRVRRRTLSKLDYFVDQRLARWWARNTRAAGRHGRSCIRMRYGVSTGWSCGTSQGKAGLQARVNGKSGPRLRGGAAHVQFRRYLRTLRFNTLIRTAFAGAPVGDDSGAVAMVRLLVGLLVVGGRRLEHVRHLQADPLAPLDAGRLERCLEQRGKNRLPVRSRCPLRPRTVEHASCRRSPGTTPAPRRADPRFLIPSNWPTPGIPSRSTATSWRQRRLRTSVLSACAA
jgi:hypothetical protein